MLHSTDLCVSLGLREEVEDNESNRAQELPVMHQGGGDSGALKCLHKVLQ